jgi:amidase
VLAASAVGIERAQTSAPPPFRFHLEEATIGDVHRAIREAQLSCRALVRACIRRARAYNGTCNQLVTEDNVSSVLHGEP